MDLKQRKLTKTEWDSIEMPVSAEENEVLDLIIKGYSNIGIRINKTNTLLSYLKIDYTPQIEAFIFKKYFNDRIQTLIDLYNIDYISLKGKHKKQLNNELNVNVIKPFV